MRFQAFNIGGGVAWVALFLFGGFAFGNVLGKDSFQRRDLIVIAISLLPMLDRRIRDRGTQRLPAYAGRPRGYAHRVDIRVDITEVWQALIEPALLAQWYAPRARVDAREGGGYGRAPRT